MFMNSPHFSCQRRERIPITNVVLTHSNVSATRGLLSKEPYVPQDTVLGPTLFNVFINDVTEAMQKRDFLSPPIQLSTEFSLHSSRGRPATTPGV